MFRHTKIKGSRGYKVIKDGESDSYILFFYPHCNELFDGAASWWKSYKTKEAAIKAGNKLLAN